MNTKIAVGATAQSPAATWESRLESISPRLQPRQLHYDPQWSLGRVLTGGNAALKSPKKFAGKRSRETQTRSKLLIDVQIRQIQNGSSPKLCDSQDAAASWHTRRLYSARSQF